MKNSYWSENLLISEMQSINYIFKDKIKIFKKINLIIWIIQPNDIPIFQNLEFHLYYLYLSKSIFSFFSVKKIQLKPNFINPVTINPILQYIREAFYKKSSCDV